ncbi:glycosyltransferase family 39 protein [Candidatus Beckwithbacteria bacterium]|nr:glycosyltransferase family 39 protein [Candidatus Beckwithbacteria bacterium]
MRQRLSTIFKTYWPYAIPLLLWLIQLAYTLNSYHQVRYEELAEAIRNVYWFKHGQVYDYLSGHLGFYLIYHLFNTIFGFSFYNPKIVKLIFALCSNYALFFILKKYLKPWSLFLALTAYCLSPTMLYFNTFLTHYGIDLILISPLLYLALTLPAIKSGYLKAFAYVLLGFLLNLYPRIYLSTIFYLPALLLISWRKASKLDLLKSLLCLGFGFSLLFFVLGLFVPWSDLLTLELKRNAVFTQVDKSFAPTLLISNFNQVLRDMFINGNSYNFNLQYPDFSLTFPGLALLAAMYFIYRKKSQAGLTLLLAIISLGCLLNIYSVISMTAYPETQGLRRSTIFLFSLYLIYWIGLWAYDHIKPKSLFLTVILVLLPLHHLLVLLPNYQNLAVPVRWRYRQWIGEDFYQNPYLAYQNILSIIQHQNINLKCEDQTPYKTSGCRYQELFSLIRSACEYNHLDCHTMYGYDPKTKQFLELNTKLWETYYFAH